jgi:hypothetical protein
MALSNWFSRRSPLEAALSRGLANGGQLNSEIRALGEFEVKSAAEADGGNRRQPRTMV